MYVLVRAFIVAVSLCLSGSLSIAAAQAPVGRVRVEGMAYDSLAMRPLAAALVSVEGTGLSTYSDAKGRFRIDSVPIGMETFGLQHPAFDSIGLSGKMLRVDIVLKPKRIVMALPSFETMWRATCGDAPIAVDSGLFYGTLQVADARQGRANIPVAVSWIDLVGGGGSLTDVTQRRWKRTTQTDDQGEYALCGVPLSTPLLLSAGGGTLDEIVFDVPPSGTRVQRRDLVVGLARVSSGISSTASGADQDSVAVASIALNDTTPRGTVRGTVVNETGMPLANASVAIDTLTEVRTGDDGRFIVRNVAIGTRGVSVIAIGREPFSTVVNVLATDTASLLVTMKSATTLDAVKVTATVASMRVRDFEDRKRQGFGAFRDSTEIQRYPDVTAVLRTIPGANIRSGLISLVFNVGTGAQCSAAREQVNFQLDGMPVTVEALESFDMQSLASVEVYSRATKIPSTLASSIMFRCAVLLWTKRGFAR